MLPSTVVCARSTIEREWIDPEYGFSTEAVGYQLVGDIPEADLVEARRIVHDQLQPCGNAVALNELTRLRAVTVASQRSENELMLMIGFYVEELAKYPHRAVAAACRKRWKFWPSLAELLDEIDRAMAELNAWRYVLDQLRQTRPQPRALTEDEARQRAAEYVDNGYSVVVDGGAGGLHRFEGDGNYRFAAER